MNAYKTRSIRPLAQKFVLATMSMVLLAAVVVLAAPSSAQAQANEPVFTTDSQVPIGMACPGGTASVGQMQLPGELSIFDGVYCRPDGFFPIVDEATCATASGSAGLNGFITGWVADAGTPTCAFAGAARNGMPGQVCPAPMQNAIGTAPNGAFADWCLFAALVMSNSDLAGDTGLPSASPVCIESDLVQLDPAAEDLDVGDEFQSASGGRFVIRTGEPTCSFGCIDGFDANCDNRIGDFCPVELTKNSVTGVGQCLAFLNPAPLTEEGADTVAGADGVATVAASAPLAQAIPVAQVESALAHTGTESTLATTGAALLAYGAVALGVQRHLKIRRRTAS